MRRSRSRRPLLTEQLGMDSILYGKPTPTMSHRAVFGMLYFLLLFGSYGYAPVPSSASEFGRCNMDVDLEGNNLNSIGCMPLSQKYLTGYYMEKHNSQLGTDFQGFLAWKCSFDNCEELIHNIRNVLGVSDLHLHRHLVGEGSHRSLVFSMLFNIQPDAVSWVENHFCEAVIIVKLPIGVFADPFELQHLVQHQVFLDADVFGDTNLELPSALSNQSDVEVHMEIEHGNLSKCCEIVIELPLHARYPPLDASGYSSIKIGAPDVFLRCRPRSSPHEALSWTLIPLNAGSGVNNVTWLVPCGNEGHTGFVSAITSVSALVSALLIVFSAMSRSTDDEIKGS